MKKHHYAVNGKQRELDALYETLKGLDGKHQTVKTIVIPLPQVKSQAEKVIAQAKQDYDGAIMYTDQQQLYVHIDCIVPGLNFASLSKSETNDPVTVTFDGDGDTMNITYTGESLLDFGSIISKNFDLHVTHHYANGEKAEYGVCSYYNGQKYGEKILHIKRNPEAIKKWLDDHDFVNTLQVSPVN